MLQYFKISKRNSYTCAWEKPNTIQRKQSTDKYIKKVIEMLIGPMKIMK